MKMPAWRTFDFVPGAVLRRRHIDHVKGTLSRLRGGLRGLRPVPLTISSAVHVGAVTTDLGVAVLISPGASLQFLLPLYVGDRIVDWNVAGRRAGPSGLTVELRRFRRTVPGFEVPSLHTQISTPAVQGNRELLPAVGLRSPVVEAGWIYRLIVTAGQTSDQVAGATLYVDHPLPG